MRAWLWLTRRGVVVLPRAALKKVMKHIHYEDENTRCARARVKAAVSRPLVCCACNS
jgi:hypothetical protein